MRSLTFSILLFFAGGLSFSQDNVYARSVIRFLTSEKCFGRGYIYHGLQCAQTFLVEEIKKNNARPLFKNQFIQTFTQSVNTFPKNCEVKVNGKNLVTGIDFILIPSSCSVNGKFNLIKADSLNYFSIEGKQNVTVSLKKKLTFSVSGKVNNSAGIEIDENHFKEIPKTLEIKVKNKLIPEFKSNNIWCYLDGTKSDSLMVFSAHYDHLGGIGKKTYFPGANDNASGVSMVLNLLKYYSTHKPKYKTVFLFFAGEEAGLLGSKFFVGSNAIDLKKIKFLINLDLLGTGEDGIMVVNGAIHQKEFDLLNKINEEKNLVKEIRKRGKASNSDHYYFSEAGVPCFFIYTMGGIKAYHDVYDIEKTLPLTDYGDVFKLITEFVERI